MVEMAMIVLKIGILSRMIKRSETPMVVKSPASSASTRIWFATVILTQAVVGMMKAWISAMKSTTGGKLSKDMPPLSVLPYSIQV